MSEIEIAKMENLSTTSYSSDPREVLTDLIEYLMTVNTQIKLLHWTAANINIHKALDTLYHRFSEIMDDIVESFMGGYKILPNQRTFQITIEITMEQHAEIFLQIESENLKKWIDCFQKQPSIMQQLTEMLSIFHKTLYIVRLSKL